MAVHAQVTQGARSTVTIVFTTQDNQVHKEKSPMSVPHDECWDVIENAKLSRSLSKLFDSVIRLPGMEK